MSFWLQVHKFMCDTDIADQFKAQPLSIYQESENFDFIFSCIMYVLHFNSLLHFQHDKIHKLIIIKDNLLCAQQRQKIIFWRHWILDFLEPSPKLKSYSHPTRTTMKITTTHCGSITHIKFFLHLLFDITRHRNVLKMYMFLLNWFIQLQDKANASTTAATKTANAAKPKVCSLFSVV